ncbi:MAG: flagellar hook capping protein [Planctomycetes bacterium]|nr:flagellar hook capping protein [Planctomycetota bacterium]
MASTGFSSQLGQQQFLQLLVAQMKSQNPMEPTSNQEFLGQLAQFSTLSGIETLNANFSDMMTLQDLTQGSSLIGKQVSYTNSSNTTSTGVVQSVGVTNGKLHLQVGSDSVTLDNVLQVTAAA